MLLSLIDFSKFIITAISIEYLGDDNKQKIEHDSRTICSNQFY